MIGLDLGTSYVKGVLIRSDGRVLSEERVKNQYCYGKNGQIEFDAADFYKTVVLVIKSLLSDFPKERTIAALSMSSASGNTVLLDNDAMPLCPAISWMDTRVQDEVNKVMFGISVESVQKITGWPLFRKFPLAHLCWMKIHRPELLNKSAMVCMSTEYINYRLTGKWGIDPSTATPFYLQDQVAGKWYLPYLKRLGISESNVPEIMPSGTVLGGLTTEAAAETGLALDTPVVLGSFDHPGAARGAGILKEGQMLLSCGTSWVGFYPVKDRDRALEQKMLVDPFLSPKGPWGAMFSFPEISNRIDFYLEKYVSNKQEKYSEFDRFASNAKPGAGGLLINLLLNSAEDVSAYSPADICRALMEGTAYLLRHRVEFLSRHGISATEIAMVGGPSVTFPWPQIIADILNVTLTVVNGQCAGAIGAAILAGIGVGIFKDEQDATNKMQLNSKSFYPDLSKTVSYQEFYKRFLIKYEKTL